MLTARTTICLHYGGCPGGLAVINGFLCTLFLSLFPVGTSSFFFCLFPFIFMKAIPPPIPSNRGAHMFWQLRLQSGVFWSPCWRMEPLWVILIILRWLMLGQVGVFWGLYYKFTECLQAHATDNAKLHWLEGRGRLGISQMFDKRDVLESRSHRLRITLDLILTEV